MSCSTTAHNLTDLKKANSAWTAASVALEARSIKKAGGLSVNSNVLNGATGSFSSKRIVTFERSQETNRPLALQAYHKDMRVFWSQYERRFKTLWTSMARESRKFLLLTVAPEIATSRHDREAYGQLRLIPELVLNELSSDPEKLIRIIEIAVQHDLSTHFCSDASMMRSLVRKGEVYSDVSRKDYLYFARSGEYPGEPMVVNWQKLQESGTSFEEQFGPLIRNGTLVEGPIFTRVVDRRDGLLTTLALVFDEMRFNVFEKSTLNKIKECQSKCWNPSCKKLDCALRTKCACCHIAGYCSADCRQADWHKHKKLCDRLAEF